MTKGDEMKDSSPHAHGRLTFTILLLLGFMVGFSPSAVLGEVKTVTHTVRQPFGGSQSPDDARIAAVARAKREALEMAGTYVQALTVVKNSRVEKDEILALTAGVVKAEIVSQKNYHTKDAFGIEVTVRVEVDTALLEGSVRKLLQDRTHLDQLKDSRAREKELLDKLTRLEEENRKPRTSGKDSAGLKEQFQETSRGLTAVELVQKASDLWVDGEYSDPRKALGYLDQAIRLKPDHAAAYAVRGNVYVNLKDYARAIPDYDQAIRLKPDYAFAYTLRGYAYENLKDYSRAIQDYDQAIRLNPDDAAAYTLRGLAYRRLGQYSRAIKDYDQAIRLKPDDAEGYFNRGYAYENLKDYSRAIKDYDQAIRLKPDDALAYDNRGNAYLILGNRVCGCSDVQKACELGLCEGYESAKKLGDCR
jgi:tetratricopeptide (TPR) repeat protein